MRSFAGAAQVTCHGYRLGLQRVLTDFGADAALRQAVAKVREHYGIEVPASAVCAVTEAHGADSAK